MSKDKNKKKKKEETNEQVVEAVMIEEEVVVVANVDDVTNQPEDSNESSAEGGFGVPNLPTPSKRAVLIILLTLGVLGLMYLGKDALFSATVNGKPIYRYQVIKRLEKDYGKQAYENMLREELLTQEAQKRSIVITQTDIDNEFKKIDASLKSQGTSLDDALKQQELTRAEVTDSIKFQILASRLVSDKTKVTDAEIKDYMEQNKDFLPKDQSAEQVRQTVIDYLKQQKEAEAIDLLLNELKGKAKINQIIQY